LKKPPVPAANGPSAWPAPASSSPWDGTPFTAAAAQGGFRSAKGVAKLVSRFHREGLQAGGPTRGRPRRPVWPRSAGTHSAGVPPPSGSGAGRHGHRVAPDAPTRLAPSAGRATGGEHLHDLRDPPPRRVLLPGESDGVPHRNGAAQAQAQRRPHRGGGSDRPTRPSKKGQIEQGYAVAQSGRLPLGCQDEAGPYPAIPSRALPGNRKENRPGRRTSISAAGPRSGSRSSLPPPGRSGRGR
jgi:hypothetical protein